jgi:histidine kinase
MKFRHPLKFHFRYTKKDALYHLRCYSQVEDYGDNPIVHLIVEDVTKQLALYEKARLNEVRMFHEDRLSALGVLTTGIAHELNQPLSTIKVITDSILYGKEEGWSLNEQELFENLEVISQQVSRMAGVIQNIRIYGREDRPQDQILVRPNDAIHNVLLMIGRQLEIAHIKLHKDFSPALPLIRTTLSRLEQVILNLVVNAQQAFENCGHKNRQIWIRSYSTDGEIIHIEIEDNAVGVPEALKVKIFDPFFTTKGVGQGTGMGLAISNSIVSELNGTIEVYNNDKGGATFAVVIPSARRDQ